MPFPTGWPPRRPSGRRSIRFFVSGNCTANYADNAFLFIDDPNANTFTPLVNVPPGAESLGVNIGRDPASPSPAPGMGDAGPPAGTGPETPQNPPLVPSDVPAKPTIWANTILVRNDKSGSLSISFDGATIHDILLEGEQQVYRNRFEGGISIRGEGGSTPAFRIAAW